MKLPCGRRLAFALLMMLFSVSVLGQSPPADNAARNSEGTSPNAVAPSLETLEVIGTRIKVPNLTSDSPITTVSQDDAQLTGTTYIENLLNSLPQVYASQGNSTAQGSTGVASINLRGLGVTRTLVLLDGRRLGPGDPQSSLGAAADVNFIPSALIDNVEVLTGGASAVYGSDAIAGVVNFHLQQNFQGVEIDQTLSAAQHSQHNGFQSALASSPYPVDIPGSTVAGRVSDTTLILGSNIGDHDGNITVYAEFRATNPILASSRDWAACPAGINDAGTGLVCAGSSNSAYGRFFPNDGGASLSNNPNGTATFVPYQDRYQYNFATTNYLQREDERRTFGALGHYQVSPAIEVYTEIGLMVDDTTSQVAPGGLFIGGSPTGTLQVPCNNPYLSASQAARICEDADGIPLPIYQPSGAPNVATITTPGLRFASEPRRDTFKHESDRVLVGGRGNINANWSYDVSASYWESDLTYGRTNDISFNNFQNSINGCAAPGSGCIPINIFQYGGLTPAAIKYVSVPATAAGSTKEEAVDTNIFGNLVDLKSPWTDRSIATAIGFEYRHDQLSYSPDEELLSGDTSLGVIPAVSGGAHDSEGYAELRIPVAAHHPFVEDLNVDIAYRYSKYAIESSDNSYSTDTYKFSADYAPVSDFRLRGGYNRAARAPNLYELFLPSVVNGDSGYSDPCAGPNPLASAAACAKSGLNPAQYGSPNLACPAGSCYAQTGGNTALKPEVATTWTLGFNVTPSWLPHFDLSVDYYDIKVKHYITALSGVQIVDGCLLNGLPSLCDLIHRAPSNGNIYSPTGYVQETNTNFGSVENRGIDAGINYQRDLESLGLPAWGTLQFKLDGTYLLKAQVTSVTSYDCAGLYGPVCGTQGTAGPLFQWRHQARLTWSTPWNVDLSVNWRHFSAVSLDTNSPQTALNAGSYDAPDGRIAAYNYLDLAGTWRITKQVTARIGVSNVLDKDPPILQAALLPVEGAVNGNTYAGVYDVLGRVIFVGLTAKF